MKTLIAVLDDLFGFVAEALFGWYNRRHAPPARGTIAPGQIPVARTLDVAPDAVSETRSQPGLVSKHSDPEMITDQFEDLDDDELDEKTTFNAMRELLAERGELDVVDSKQPPLTPPVIGSSRLATTSLPSTDDVAFERTSVVYAASLEVPLYVAPEIQLDGVLTQIPYGTMLLLLGPGIQTGDWLQVQYDAFEGYVQKDDVVDRAAYVQPDFTDGTHHDADDPNTVKIRAMLADMFAAGAVREPLTTAEYVQYRLIKKGRQIAWPEVRPRKPGEWHHILRETPGVQATVHPKTSSVMEYVSPEKEGQLAYVEAVFPDESISVTCVEGPNGTYCEKIIPKEEWRELRPVFLQVG